MHRPVPSLIASIFCSVLLLAFGSCLLSAPAPIFNVKSFGATGNKTNDARPTIQKAIDACAAAGGGTVLFPPGDYTSGTLHLRSHVHVQVEAGATVFASRDPQAYDTNLIPSKAALFYGDKLDDVSLAGQGTLDGQAEYEWREDDFEHTFDHKTLMQKLGKSILRSFPKDFPKRDILPHLLWLGRSTNIQVTGLKLLHSPSWNIALYGCERARFDGLYVYSSLKEAVWADGIDLDGCKNINISNCNIETGDDCVVFISADPWGPALPCENITVSHCRLSSASAGVKFSEGNSVRIRNVWVTDTVLTNVNRGFVFANTLGGEISDVLLANLTIDCNRFDWFWSGDAQPFYFRITRVSELTHEPPKPNEAAPGSIRNVTIRNVIARAKGSSLFHGHAESWIDGLTIENLKLHLATDPAAPYDKAEHALHFQWARNLKLSGVEVFWEKPSLEAWQSALCFEDVSGLDLDRFSGGPAWLDRDLPAILFNNVSDAVVGHSQAREGAKVFLKVSGQTSRGIRLQANDLHHARVPFQLNPEVPATAVVLADVESNKAQK